MSASEMESLASDIVEVIEDYRYDDGFQITVSRVLGWVEQFDEADRLFILQELRHVFRKKRYISKAKAKDFLRRVVENLARDYGYDTPQSFLRNSSFLDLQEEGKSQKELLRLLDEVTQENYIMSLSDCGSQSSKNFVYLDDVLCTNNTSFYDLKKWLEQTHDSEAILDKVLNGETNLMCVYIFAHRLNKEKLFWRFKYELRAFERRVYKPYSAVWIDNDHKNPHSKLDFLFPLREGQSEEVLSYFAQLQTGTNGVFRKAGTPANEVFFSSPENRTRLENIFLNKGIEILKSVSIQKENIRPLGFTLPSHKNFGFGTLCFTWRNVPNNTPLVFWYSSPIWMPLFEKRVTAATDEMLVTVED